MEQVPENEGSGRTLADFVRQPLLERNGRVEAKKCMDSSDVGHRCAAKSGVIEPAPRAGRRIRNGPGNYSGFFGRRR